MPERGDACPAEIERQSGTRLPASQAGETGYRPRLFVGFAERGREGRAVSALFPLAPEDSTPGLRRRHQAELGAVY